MTSLVTVYNVDAYQQAVMLKSQLEAGGVEVFLGNEHVVQTSPHYSQLAGGIKIQVSSTQMELARDLLISFGYIKPQAEKNYPLLQKLNDWTSKWPVIGDKSVQVRLFLLLMCVVTLLVLILSAIIILVD